MNHEPPHSAALFRAVSPWFIIVTVGACLALAAHLVPQKSELLKRLMEDGHHARALELAGNIEISAPDEQSPEIEIRAAIPVETPLAKLKRELASNAETKPDLENSISAVSDAQACMVLMRELEQRMSPEQREKVYLAIAHSALAQEKPGLAADIFEEAAAKGVRSENFLQSEVQAYRWSGQPAKAVAALEKWAVKAPVPAFLQDTEIALYREVNQPQKALDVVMQKLEAEKKSAGYQKDTILLASEVAANAGQMERVLDVTQSYLKSLPAGTATLDDLSLKRVVPDESWKKFAQLTAQHFEWGDRQTEAYDLYEKLAVLGDVNALDRILDLNGGLNRDGDVLEVLRRVVPVAGRPELDLQCARMLADAGEYKDADAAFAKWMESHPRDSKVLLERAALADDESRYDDAMALYRKALELEPGNVQVQKEIADIQISRREFREAFAFYEKLPESQHDNFTLENYALLAEALAEYPAYNRALVLRQHRLKHPTTQDFLQLARSFQLMGDDANLIATYEKGLKQIPGSRILKIELANVYRLEDRYEEALALLAKPEMKADMHAMTLFIEVCALKEDYVTAMDFLGRGIEKKFAFGPDTRLDLGHIYYNNGYLTEADALYSSVPDEPALWPLLANARFKMGNFASAESYQRKFLASLTTPDAQAWMLLGDILKAEGRELDARDAYAKSLAQMEDKIPSSFSTPEVIPPQKTDQPVSIPPPASATLEATSEAASAR